MNSITIEDAIKISKAIFEDCLFKKLYWTTNITILEDTLSEYFDWWTLKVDESRNSLLTQEFYCTSLDRYILEATCLLDHYVKPEDYWRVWYTTPLGNDLIIERGEDFRVLEFERAVLNNQIETTKTIERMIKEKHNYIFRRR